MSDLLSAEDDGFFTVSAITGMTAIDPISICLFEGAGAGDSGATTRLSIAQAEALIGALQTAIHKSTCRKCHTAPYDGLGLSRFGECDLCEQHYDEMKRDAESDDRPQGDIK